MELIKDFVKDDCLRVGTFVNTHGVRGDIKVYPHTDDVTRFSDLEFVYMEAGKQVFKCYINSVRYFKNMAIIHFKDIDNINDIEKYKGSDLYITREQAVPLEDDEYFICDIIGAKAVTDEDRVLGEVVDVLQTGANDVYVIKMENGKELLVPVIPDCVLDIDTEAKKVLIHLMPGLMS